jgi:hypothetical protein
MTVSPTTGIPVNRTNRRPSSDARAIPYARTDGHAAEGDTGQVEFLEKPIDVCDEEVGIIGSLGVNDHGADDVAEGAVVSEVEQLASGLDPTPLVGAFK